MIPKLPDPKDLQPFPTTLSIKYIGHEAKVTCISVDPQGRFLATGSHDNTARVWEISTGRQLKSWILDEPIESISWNPCKQISLLAVGAGKNVILLNPKVESLDMQSLTDEIFKNDAASSNRFKSPDCKWISPTQTEFTSGFRLIIQLNKPISHFSWHRKGDYFATLTTEATSSSSLIHQISKQSTQNPFKKSNGLVQRVCFHPTKPILFIATQRFIRIYDMMEQKLIKKLNSGVKWISSMDIHPSGIFTII